MTERHHVWIQPPPTWYDGIPLTFSPTLYLSFDLQPILESRLIELKEYTIDLLEPGLPPISLSYTLNIP